MPQCGVVLPAGPDIRLRFSEHPTPQEISRARVFTEPLVPLGTPASEENNDLAQALTRFASAPHPDRIEAASPLERFLRKHPRSAWRPSLLLELGIFYRQTGHFSRALKLWEEAWQATKQIKEDRRIQAVADHAVAELAQLNAWIGRYDELEGLAKELRGRELRGSSRVRFEAAMEGLWRMQNRPEIAFKCGPFALESVKRVVRPVSPGSPSIENMHSTRQGTSLPQLVAWGKELGMDLRMVKRPKGAGVPVPSVVHWKLNHYGAIVKQDGDKYLVTDATFSLNYGSELWVTKAALDEEASGYFLVPADRIPDGWSRVKQSEAEGIWGKGFTDVSNPDATTPCDEATPCDSAPCGMPSYRFHLMLASLLGTTVWNYNALYTAIPNPKIKGAGRLANIDSPWANDTTTYAYDELRRVLTQSINGSARTVAYDVLGRVSSLVNALGTFTPTYDNATHFGLTQLAYPNDMTSLFEYAGAQGDFRMMQMWNQNKYGSTLSQFDYLYNADGLITKWTQQLGSSTKTWKPDYDLVDQLAGVEVQNAGETAILKSYGYGYDKAGNRITEQVGNHTAGQLSVTVTKAEFNTQNQLTDRQNSGAMPVRFAGTADEPAKTLTINGAPATARDDQSFVGWAELSPGNNPVTLQATDYGDNAGTPLNRTVTVLGGVAKDPEFDLNGNMTSVHEPATGQMTTYTYDGEDRLAQVVKGGVTYTITHDGLSRMRKLQFGGTTKTFMWLGLKLAEERDATGATVVKQFFEQGVRDSGVNKYYTFDHLGSIREMVAANGSTVLARYEYDPYGRRTRIAGAQDADFGFTGHYYHATTGLYLAPFRAYDPDLGRWLNRDPIEEEGGLNLYAYVFNDPINDVDGDGLQSRAARKIIESARGNRRPFYNSRSLRGEVTPGTMWTKGKEKTWFDNVKAHWKKHRDEFPNMKGPKDYFCTAHRELSNPTRDSTHTSVRTLKGIMEFTIQRATRSRLQIRMSSLDRCSNLIRRFTGVQATSSSFASNSQLKLSEP